MNVIFLECVDSYGYGFSAGASKVTMMAKGLHAAGATCFVNNGIAGSTCVSADEIKEVDGVEVTTYKSSSNGYAYYFWLPIRNFPKLWNYLKSHRDKSDKNIVILTTPLFHIFVLYTLLCRILGYRIACISHEWIPTLNHTGFRDKYYNDPLYTKFFGYLVHALLPISEYIIEKCQRFKKPFFKVPALADYPDLLPQPDVQREHYFLYCAQAGYFRIAKFIIDSYKLYFDNKGNYTLRMIMAGTEQDINKICKYVLSLDLGKEIVIESKLPYDILLSRYRNASALLIPLDPDYEQDSARFPQKIAEYAASASPIIATNIGEIKTYFSVENCIRTEFSVESFANSFSWVERNPSRAKEIGINGFRLGEKKFNCMNVCNDLFDFLKTI